MRTLIPDNGYDVSWTRMNRFFHARQPGNLQDNAHPAATDEYPWLSIGAKIFLSLATDTNSPVVLADNFRNLLMFQNQSLVPAASTDIAPTLFINIDGPVNLGANDYAFTLAPGVGLVLDTRVLTNSIYIAWTSEGAFDASETFGTLTYGRTPNSPPLSADAMAAMGPMLSYGTPAGPVGSSGTARSSGRGFTVR